MKQTKPKQTSTTKTRKPYEGIAKKNTNYFWSNFETTAENSQWVKCCKCSCVEMLQEAWVFNVESHHFCRRCLFLICAPKLMSRVVMQLTGRLWVKDENYILLNHLRILKKTVLPSVMRSLSSFQGCIASYGSPYASGNLCHYW